MKTLSTLLLSLCFIASGFAQTEKGKVLAGLSSSFSLGGSNPTFATVGFRSTSTGSNKNNTTSFNLSPRAGYFFIDNLVAGLDIDFTTSSTKADDDSFSSSSNSVRVGPFARYYFPTGNLFPFVEANVGFGSSKGKFESTITPEIEFRSSITSFGVGAGLGVPVGDQFMFDVILGYRNLTQKDPDDENSDPSKVSEFGLLVGFSVFLGGSSE